MYGVFASNHGKSESGVEAGDGVFLGRRWDGATLTWFMWYLENGGCVGCFCSLLLWWFSLWVFLHLCVPRSTLRKLETVFFSQTCHKEYIGFTPNTKEIQAGFQLYANFRKIRLNRPSCTTDKTPVRTGKKSTPLFPVQKRTPRTRMKPSIVLFRNFFRNL